jgi:hypothetical protein
MIGCVFITIAGFKASELTIAPPKLLFGHSQKKLNIISLKDRHGVASLRSLNQPGLPFASPLKGKVSGEGNNLLTFDQLLLLPSGKEEINLWAYPLYSSDPNIEYS